MVVVENTAALFSIEAWDRDSARDSEIWILGAIWKQPIEVENILRIYTLADACWLRDVSLDLFFGNGIGRKEDRRVEEFVSKGWNTRDR